MRSLGANTVTARVSHSKLAPRKRTVFKAFSANSTRHGVEVRHCTSSEWERTYDRSGWCMARGNTAQAWTASAVMFCSTSYKRAETRLRDPGKLRRSMNTSPRVRPVLDQLDTLDSKTVKIFKRTYIVWVHFGRCFKVGVSRAFGESNLQCSRRVYRNAEQGLTYCTLHVNKPIIDVVNGEWSVSSLAFKMASCFGRVGRDNWCYNGPGHCWERRTPTTNDWWSVYFERPWLSGLDRAQPLWCPGLSRPGVFRTGLWVRRYISFSRSFWCIPMCTTW